MRARRIAEDATNQIQASGTAIIQRLAPELTRLVDRAVRQRLWTIRLRTVAISAGAGITLLLGAGAAAYIYGYRAGNVAGLMDGHMVNAAVAAGPSTFTYGLAATCSSVMPEARMNSAARKYG